MIVLDYQDRRPLYEQIAEKLEQLIVRGVLAPEEQMPSVRSLAMELSINPNTIQKAYARLETQGYIYPVRGRGNFVSPREKVVEERKKKYLEELSEKLSEGHRMGIEYERVKELLDEVFHTGGEEIS